MSMVKDGSEKGGGIEEEFSVIERGSREKEAVGAPVFMGSCLCFSYVFSVCAKKNRE